MSQLDLFDRAILRELQCNCRQSTEQIAAAVALSATAVQRRIRRLRESGVIRAEQAIVEPSAIGRTLSILVEVTLVGGRSDIIADFKRQVQAIPEVQQCYYVTGDYDFMLIVSAVDVVEYERLTHRLFFDNPHIQRFHTVVVIEAIKVGLSLPIT